jgi:hypothetical protein
MELECHAFFSRARTLFVAAACIASCAGCSIRYDAAGVTRVGVGLWGFGDPPGVNWNLDAPRREFPELPATTRPELPPRSDASRWRSDSEQPSVPRVDASSRIESPIEDNHDCAPRRLIDSGCPVAVGALDRRL